MPRERRQLIVAAVAAAAVVIAIVVVAVALSSGGSHKSASGCSWQSEAPAAKHASRPPGSPPRTGTVAVKVATTRGPMTFTLDRAAAPCTVASFVSLAQQHYFDGTTCHRLVTDSIYVLQCGDPTGLGSGGPGYTIPDEAMGNETYPAGTIAMARTADPHSGGSQFFIVYRDSPSLSRNLGALQYTVFGTVTAGLSAVTTVADAGTADGSSDGSPKLPITLTAVSPA